METVTQHPREALERPKVSILHHLMACRLCWRITLVVFGLILAVESAILIPSAARFEQAALDRLGHAAQLAVEPVLLLGRGVNSSGLLTRDLAPLVDRYGIKGIGIYTPAGALVTVVGVAPSGFSGNPAALSHLATRISRDANGVDASALEIAWRSDAPGNPVAVVRIDAGAVPGELAAYLLRIGGLVALIVLVVTVGTMLVLYRWVLRTLLLLRDSALAAGREPHRATDFLLTTTRRDELGDLVTAHNAMLERVTESKQRDREMAEERARFLTRHDPLTRLPNRMALIEYVDGLAGLRGDSPHKVSLLLLEVAQFSVLSADIGAANCDDLIGQMAVRLNRFAPQQFIAHFGEDRFAMVDNTLPCDVTGISQLAESLLRELGGQGGQGEQGGVYRVGAAKSVSLVLRIGIARMSAEADKVVDGRTLLSHAELALSEATGSEGAHYSFYSPELAAASRERQSLARDLKLAIEAGDLYPVFQPKVALGATGRAAGGTAGNTDGDSVLAGAEVLLRWNHATRGMVPPDVFIELAESTGLIAAIGDMVLRAAARVIRGLLDRHGWAPPLAVNLSTQQFADSGLVAQITQVLAEERIPAHLLELEITETSAMKDAARTAQTIEALRATGVRVAIDDFGTGYSSLSYLRRFALDSIKIDKSFVDDIGVDANAEAVCDAILRLGKSLNTKIVAEGVENSRQLEFLRARRCDEVQGYYFSKPLSLDAFEKDWIAVRAAA